MMRAVTTAGLGLLLLMGVTIAQGPVVIDVGQIITVSGEVVEGARIVCRDGKIAAIGKDLKVPKDAVRIVLPQGVAFPGFVDAGGFIGAHRHRNETTRAVMCDLRMSDALDPSDPAIGLARRAGITTFHLMPGESDLVGGQTAVAKVNPDGRVTWLRREALLKVSLATAAWDKATPPTHLLGGIEGIASLKDNPVVKPFWATGCVVAARSPAEIAAVTGLKQRQGIEPLLLTNANVVAAAGHLAGKVRGVLLEPLRPQLGNHWRRAAARLAAAGVPFAFASRAPVAPAEGLRLSAVVARMGGLSRSDAWKALTLDAARLLGVDDRVGSLEVGKDADILVMTREPSDPRARLMWVVQDGRVVANPLSIKENR
ncbi:MAG: amidohydrolase family protein [Planctomycetota bacterium]|nr:amidohydrolase family protein [Planctomycetota bacterium]